MDDPVSASETLLIIDDEPLMTDLFRLQMMKNGFEVVMASSGQEALTKIESDGNVIQLVITDMTMPGMDGLAVARALAQARPSLPVLIATGHSTDLPDLPPNVQGVVQKPYHHRDLAVRIRQILAKKA